MHTTSSTPIARRAVLGGLAASLAAAAMPALAQGRQLPMLKLIIGFPGGAGVDPVARTIADKLRGALWTNVIVENRPGAGGRLAVEALKASPPDGSTLLLAPASNFTLFPHVFRKLSYDPQTDAMPVSQAFTYHMGLIAGPANPARNLQEYVAWARKDPKNGMFAIPALGSVPHFVGDQFAKAAHVDLTPVAYRGSAPIWNDLMGGQVPSYFSPIGNDAITRHRAGQVRILGLADSARSKLLPDVPTFKENGFPVVIDEWFGFFAPPKTPADLIQAQNEAIRTALAHPEVGPFLARFQTEPEPSSPQALAQRIKTETADWGRIVQASGFKPED
jgi:tripartite-type tricarboxylate transporter receptor subunit TctC